MRRLALDARGRHRLRAHEQARERLGVGEHHALLLEPHQRLGGARDGARGLAGELELPARELVGRIGRVRPARPPVVGRVPEPLPVRPHGASYSILETLSSYSISARLA